MRRHIYAFLLFSLIVAPATFAQGSTDDVEARPTVTITDASINAGESVTWKADTVYVLDGIVFVEEGATLTIDPGTVIKANDGQSTAASALVVARGGQIFADGTKDAPIIFTSVQDNISSPDLLDYSARGLWGGIILLGNAPTNNPGDATGDYKEIEGVNVIVADGDTRAEYGGSDPDDSSGSMSYVSIRHTGISVGEESGNEIQGLTLGGVGAGTNLDYIEVYASNDDGVEFFGGTVGIKHFVSVFNADDAVDFDQGWNGKGQFWFVLQGTDKAGAAAEQDGAGGDEFYTPFAIPTIYNVTYVGNGVGNTSTETDRGELLMFRDNAGGHYANSIFTDFENSKGGYALTIEDVDNTGAKTEDSQKRWEAGDLSLSNNIWWNFGAGNDPASFIDATDAAAVAQGLIDAGNSVQDPRLGGVSRAMTPDGGIDPRPAQNGPAFFAPRKAIPAGDEFFEATNYVGAFGDDNWMEGWTALDQLGHLGDLQEKRTEPNPNVEARPTVTVTDASINAGESVMWTADNVYILDGIVFVEDGASLTIEEGTVIKANDGQNVNASALVVSRGGKIYANGTKDNPIIFTSVQDNISSDDLLDYTSRGLWGGVILLGHAGTNNPGDATGDYKSVEGVNTIVADGDLRAQYGGTKDDDSSGSMTYVSIRYTGMNIGEESGNEIQGLTLGGVGAGTNLDYIEVYSSGDDGVEFFGGTVGIKHFVSVFNADDAVDFDQGWRGKGQHWFVLQGTDKAGAAAEQDGAGGDEFYTPFAIPTIYNVTYVGNGVGNTSTETDRGELLMFRDNAGGHYANSIFTDFDNSKGGYALTIEDVDNTGAKTEDSQKRWEAGDLTLSNNLWWGFGAGNDPLAFVNATDAAAVVTGLVAAGNVVEDPKLAGVSRAIVPDGGLDPRPNGNSAAWTMPRKELPLSDPFFMATDYVGAFGGDNWMQGWTALDQLGHLGNLYSPVDRELGTELPESIALDQNYPNPFNPSTTISYALNRDAQVTLKVYDLMGREVATLVQGLGMAGHHTVSFDASRLATGTYIYRLTAGATSVQKVMTLLK